MSSCDSDDYKSADEDINISDIGEDELDQLLADVPDNDVDTTEKESDKLNSQQNISTLVAKNVSLEDDDGSKLSETPVKFHDSDQENITKTTSEILSDAIQEDPVLENVPSKEASIHNVISKDQEVRDSTVTNSNTVLEDHSSGWDFEDDDIVLPDSPEKKLESLSKKDLESKVSSTNPEIDNSGWSSWGNWGVSNLISSASEGMSNLSYQMTSGFTSILENTIGAPDPEELAKELQKTQKQINKLELTGDSTGQDFEQKSPTGSSDLFRIGDIIGGVSNLGNRVISGGLDTLETLGKKTMEVLQEGDPGFKKKRALLFQGEKVILSQVLRDAKEKAEASELEEEQDTYYRKAQYETLFDDFHGLVHLEALEMISKQCEIKLSGMTSKNTSCDDLVHYNNVLSTVKQLFLQQETCDVNEKTVTSDVGLQANLNSALKVLELEVNIKNIIEVDAIISSRLEQVFSDAIEIHVKAISDLAQFTALSIELFHRIAELLILKKNDNYKDDFQALVSITAFTKCKIGDISECYSSKLMGFGDKGFSPLITNIFLEASNSGNYLENAFDLFLPILQLNALV